MPGAGQDVTQVTVTFSPAIHSIEAVKRAAYELMARAHIAIDGTSEAIVCTLVPTAKGIDIDVLAHEFQREVLDQGLRLVLEQRTEPMRAAILGLAFSRTGLQDG